MASTVSGSCARASSSPPPAWCSPAPSTAPGIPGPRRSSTCSASGSGRSRLPGSWPSPRGWDPGASSWRSRRCAGAGGGSPGGCEDRPHWCPRPGRAGQGEREHDREPSEPVPGPIPRFSREQRHCPPGTGEVSYLPPRRDSIPRTARSALMPPARFRSRLLLALSLFVLPSLRPAPAPAQSRPAAAPVKPDTARPAGPFDRLHFRSIGPAAPSGRIDDFAVYEKNPAIFYVASATGGLWKTVNFGTTFAPVFEKQAVSSIGDVAIAPNDPNVVWVGTGEANNRQSSSWGDGIYKSTDGGAHWTNLGLRESYQIARIVVDPVDNDIVYVAALGNLWAAGGERGIYKTTDGGLSWSRVLDPGPDAGGTDLVMDPGNRKVLYAATYERRRASWGFNGGGPASGIWKTGDGGRTRRRLETRAPQGAKGGR